ncbi:MAG: CapA family protein [Bacteroidota bacterium]
MSINLMCAGDLMTGENVHHFHRGIVTKFKGRYPDLISEDARNLIGKAEILLLNYEASLAPDSEMNSYNIERGVYVAPLESLELLKSLKTGLIVNVANNHFGQHGSESAKYTIRKLEENGIRVIGKNNMPLILNLGETKSYFWGCSLVKDKYYNGSYFKSGYDTLVNDLKLPVKESGDIWILSIHWGEEYYTLQNSAQRQLAEKLSQAGFDFIIGHHPHVVQPVEIIGNTKVMYSLGNFIFDQNFSGLTQTGLVSHISFVNMEMKLFFSKQENYRLIDFKITSEPALKEFCKGNFHPRKPLLMRIRMKLELVYRFYELNGAILRAFSSRLFGA